jgi:hypothetical protein
MLRANLFVACALFVAAPAFAESPFDGTWKMDPAKAKWSDRPVEVQIANGMYDCRTCTPAYKIKADGSYQKRPGGVDESSVQLIGDRMLKFASRKDGQLVGETLMTLSADGTSRTIEGVEYAPNGIVTRSTATHRRVGPAAAGAHPLSGKWVMDRLASASDEQMLISFKAEGDQLRMSTPDGYSYAASFGGAPVIVAGDRNKGTVQLRRLSPTSFEETNRREGKLMNVSTFTVRSDGRLLLRSENKQNGAVEEFELVRQ